MFCGNTVWATQSYSHFLMTEKTQAKMSEPLTLCYFKVIITFDNISTAEPFLYFNCHLMKSYILQKQLP